MKFMLLQAYGGVKADIGPMSTWTPEEIKSALMTSTLQTATKEDGVTPADPFDDGAGSIRANRAVSRNGRATNCTAISCG